MSSPYYYDDYDYDSAPSQPKSKKGHKRKCSRDVKEKSYKTSAWTAEEDAILKDSLMEGLDIKEVAEQLNRSQSQCLHRWQKVLDPKLVKGSWTREEDELLKNLVHQYGAKNWSVIAAQLKGRIGKQCRERWYNHLDPDIRKDPWTPEEDRTIYEFHAKYGNKWSEMAKILIGRPSNAIKNHWNSTLKRRLMYVNGEEVPEDGARRERKTRKFRGNRKRKATEDPPSDLEDEDEDEDVSVSRQESAEDLPSAVIEDNDYIIKTEMSDSPIQMTMPGKWETENFLQNGNEWQMKQRAPISGFNDDQYGELFSELSSMSSAPFDTDELFTPVWGEESNDSSLTRNVIDLSAGMNTKHTPTPSQSFYGSQQQQQQQQQMGMYEMAQAQMNNQMFIPQAGQFNFFGNPMMTFGFQPMDNSMNPFSPYASMMAQQHPMQMNNNPYQWEFTL